MQIANYWFKINITQTNNTEIIIMNNLFLAV